MSESGHKPLPSWAKAIREAAGALAGARIEDASRDARRLVSAATGASPADLIRVPDSVLTAVQYTRLQEMIARRSRHEPISRILGEREFYGRSFQVTPDVLDPRPDTETLIEAVLEVVDRERGRDRPLRIIDVGTGTGCILLTLLAELPNATGLATDVSPAALAVAEENARRIGLGARVRFALKRSLEPPCDTFDILVSNPPYIETSVITGLAPDVRDYDPILALDGGPDGLFIYREIASRLCEVVPLGWAFFEVGATQAEPVASLLAQSIGVDRTSVQVWPDLDGRERCVAIPLHR